ncbi:MAG: LptF/LptG family permease, partial [Desulfosarcina sp.]
LLLSVGTTLGENGRYPPAVGMWMPNMVLGGFGVYLLVRSARERPIRFKWPAPPFRLKSKWFGRK